MMHTTVSFPSAYAKELASYFLYTDGTSRFLFGGLSVSDPAATETRVPPICICWRVLSKGGSMPKFSTAHLAGEHLICLQPLPGTIRANSPNVIAQVHRTSYKGAFSHSTPRSLGPSSPELTRWASRPVSLYPPSHGPSFCSPGKCV